MNEIITNLTFLDRYPTHDMRLYPENQNSSRKIIPYVFPRNHNTGGARILLDLNKGLSDLAAPLNIRNRAIKVLQDSIKMEYPYRLKVNFYNRLAGRAFRVMNYLLNNGRISIKIKFRKQLKIIISANDLTSPDVNGKDLIAYITPEFLEKYTEEIKDES